MIISKLLPAFFVAYQLIEKKKSNNSYFYDENILREKRLKKGLRSNIYKKGSQS
jgi:hypothetical protein